MTIITLPLVLCALVNAADTGNLPRRAAAAPFSLGNVFTFLFLTLGPFKAIGPFATMTQGRDAASKRHLACLTRRTWPVARGSLVAERVRRWRPPRRSAAMQRSSGPR